MGDYQAEQTLLNYTIGIVGSRDSEALLMLGTEIQDLLLQL